MLQSPPSTSGTRSRSTAVATRSATWRATMTTRERLWLLRLAGSGWKRVTGRSPRSSTVSPVSRSAPRNPACRSAAGASSGPGPWAPALEGTPIKASIYLRYLDPDEDVRAISKHPSQTFGRRRSPHAPPIHDQVLDRRIDLGSIDKVHSTLNRRATFGDGQANPRIVAPARDPNRVRVIE